MSKKQTNINSFTTYEAKKNPEFVFIKLQLIIFCILSFLWWVLQFSFFGARNFFQGEVPPLKKVSWGPGGGGGFGP